MRVFLILQAILEQEYNYRKWNPYWKMITGNGIHTYKMFDADAFAHMKQGAYFINVGRGTAVDTDALVEALNSGRLAGACVDVTDPEPLPKEHPLWEASGILITPHVSGGFHLPETHNRIIEIAAKNIRHCVAGEPYDNVVNMLTGYGDNR